MSEENGVTIENGKTRIGIIPVDGDYTHSVIKDNAILYNEVYEGADVQYTVLDSSIKEDIVLQQPTDREVYEYELQIPGYQAEVKDNQVYIYPEGRQSKMRSIFWRRHQWKMLPGKSVSWLHWNFGKKRKNNPDRKTR